MHNVDNKKRCFSTGGLWLQEEEKIRIEFAWDGQDAKGKVIEPFSVSIEVDMSQAIARVFTAYKWTMLCQFISLLTMRGLFGYLSVYLPLEDETPAVNLLTPVFEYTIGLLTTLAEPSMSFSGKVLPLLLYSYRDLHYSQ